VATPSDERVGDEGERIGVRAYRRGDPLRNVYWALTARHGQLIVSERQGSAQTFVDLHVDGDPCHHCGEGPDCTFEWSLRLAASACSTFVARNARVRVWLGRQCFDILPGRTQLARFFDSLAAAEPCVPDRDLGFAGRPAPARTGPAAFVVVITTDAGAEAASFVPRARLIVLRRAAFATKREDQATSPLGRAPTAPPRARRTAIRQPADIDGRWSAWIWLDDRRDIEGQFVSQWKLRAQEVWCGED
jgi:uncharacterized protein (DUF58 family)